MALLTLFTRAWTTIAPAIRGGWRCWLVMFALIVSTGMDAAAQSTTSREYQIKAVFLFNFLQFVEWPPDTFPDGNTPIRIGVLGNDPFGSALEATVRNETINDRPLMVKRSRRVDDLLDCHLIFISGSEARRLDSILSEVYPRPILTVSDLDGFARQGGVIAFYTEGRKVRFEINIATARRLGLKLSSQLLSLGRIVESDYYKEGD